VNDASVSATATAVIVRARRMRVELSSSRARSSSVGQSHLLNPSPIDLLIGTREPCLKVGKTRNGQLSGGA
jgi:hypothetical protein